MKKILFLYLILGIVFTGCKSTAPITKSVGYKGMYDEQPVTVLIMAPINRSTNVEAKEYFHSTLNMPMANAGFYVLPSFLSMEVLKNESAYDSELFLDSSLTKFGEVFGADLALFTIIHKWDKSSLSSKVSVEIEYIIKSTKTQEILYTRRGDIVYDASVSSDGSAIGVLVSIAASAINTATTKYVDVARACNAVTFKDLPAGKYSPLNGKDGEQLVGKKEFKARVNKNYR
ncbi:MAG: GNA1162 family protein [Aequorivita sp.]